MNAMTDDERAIEADRAERRRAPALRSVDPRDGLSPAGASFNIGKKGEYAERRFFREDARPQRAGR